MITKEYLKKVTNEYFDLLKAEEKRDLEQNERIENYKKEHREFLANFFYSTNIISAVKENLKTLIKKYLERFEQPKYPNLNLQEDLVAEEYIKKFDKFRERQLLKLLSELVIKNNPEEQTIKQFIWDIRGLFPKKYNEDINLDKLRNGKKLILKISISSWKNYGTATYKYSINNLYQVKKLGKLLDSILYEKPLLTNEDYKYFKIDSEDFGTNDVYNCKYFKKFKIFKNGKFELEFDSEETVKRITDFLVNYKDKLNG